MTIDRVVVNPYIHFGKLGIAGTRITVQNALELMNEGLTFEQIVKDYYPAPTFNDIRACVQYAIALAVQNPEGMK